MNNVSTDLLLCMYLDGTLLKSDLLLASCSTILAQLLMAIQFSLWLFRAKAYLEERASKRVPLDVTYLSYPADLLDYIANEHERGHIAVALATASHRLLADRTFLS